VSTDECTGLQIRTPNKLPRYLLIEVDKPSFEPWPGLPANVYPICNLNLFMYYVIIIKYLYIFTATKTLCNIKLKLPTRLNPNHIKITTFPVVHGIALSTYKVQGDTLNAMVIANWRSNTSADKPEQGYVMVSCCKTRQNLLILEPLTMNACNYFNPKEYVLNEDVRLSELSLSTINNFYKI